MSNISDLKFDDKNFNQHTEYGMSLLEKSLRENGAGRSILIDKDNNIIAGNGIIEAAGNIGLEDLQIVETDGTKIVAVKRTDIALDSEQGRTMALADNATAAADLSWDKGNMDEVSEQFGIDPGDWISDWDSQTEQEVEEDEAPEVDESEPPKSELGKVYQLGNHRLMCGDSTDAGSVAILMDGQKADMVFTDPPYGYKYQSNFRAKTEKFEILKNDDKILDFFPLLKDFNNGFVFVCTTWKTLDKWLPLFKNYYDLTNMIIWDKGGGGLGDLRHTFSTDYEIILCSNNNREITGKRIGSVWTIHKDNPNDYTHATQKPVQVSSNAIANTTMQNDLILDTFGGSGSTLIACEQLERKCYMMELDPKYCDVIRKRYWKFTHDGDEDGWEEGTPAI